MNLSRIPWLNKWLLQKKGSARSRVWVTADNVQVKPTHVSLAGGCLYVPDEDLSEFYAKYLKYALVNKREINLTEQPLVSPDGNSYSPVIIDIDLRYRSQGLTWEMTHLEDAIKD